MPPTAPPSRRSLGTAAKAHASCKRRAVHGGRRLSCPPRLINRGIWPRAVQTGRSALRARAEALLRPDRRFGRLFENLILALIVLSVASVIVEATPGLPAW